MSEYGNLNFRAVDKFSNPGVFVVIDCVPLFMSSFLNLNFRGSLTPHAPLLSTALNF